MYGEIAKLNTNTKPPHNRRSNTNRETKKSRSETAAAAIGPNVKRKAHKAKTNQPETRDDRNPQQTQKRNETAEDAVETRKKLSRETPAQIPCQRHPVPMGGPPRPSAGTCTEWA